MPDYSEIYRRQHNESWNLWRLRIQRMFNDTARSMAAIANDPQAKFVKSFNFSYNERLNSKIDNIMLTFHDNMLEAVKGASEESWNISNTKNDFITQEYLTGITGLNNSEKYFQRNLEGLKSFITRKSDAGSLSERIWKTTAQLRNELEIQLGYGIMNGDSASTISRRIRYYQKNPEMLFRRIRDKNGNLVLSEAARNYHPGRGVYRSSYKNALRLARNETNLSYREADFNRWNQLDFVTGVLVSLSASHPIRDICDDLKGSYPKEFKFTGFHPQCFCIATPILMTKEDFMAQLRGEEYNRPDQVTSVPDGFNSWVEANKERVSGWKSQPFFIRDNFKYGNIQNGLKVFR